MSINSKIDKREVVIQRTHRAPKRKESLHETTQINVTNIMPSKRSQTQDNSYCLDLSTHVYNTGDANVWC